MEELNKCPFCGKALKVEKLRCTGCSMAIEGDFPTSRLAQLSVAQQRFIELFVLASGSLKQMAEELGVSYPTIRTRLDRIIECIQERIADDGKRKEQIIEAVGRGEVSAEVAAELIKKI